MTIYQKLNLIQCELKAPKNQRNNFGGYNYRNCEDILEALKPLLEKTKTSLVLNDKPELIGDRFYIKATATLINSEVAEQFQDISVSAYAREPLNKKGMDEAQITGATSSYARKYALNGLFAIDDTKDSDSTNTHGIDTKGNVKSELNHDELAEISELLEMTKTDINAFKDYFKVGNLKDIPFGKAKDLLIKKLQKAQK